MIYFSSDFHLGHRNIAGPKVSKWKDGFRDFDDEFKMSQLIIENINKIVKENDILFFLGDWSFGNKKNIYFFRKQLSVKDIRFIFGNHDERIEKNIDIIIEEEDLIILPQNLFTSAEHYKEISVSKQNEQYVLNSESKLQTGQRIILFHYPLRSWHKSGKDSWMLYGHCHSKIEHLNVGLTMDVGIDNAYKLLGEYRPFSYNEIKDILSSPCLKF